MSFKIQLYKMMDAYHKIDVATSYVLWSLWGSFVAIFGAGILGLILLPLNGSLYTGLAIVFFEFMVVFTWLILTFENLREGSGHNRISSLETELNLTREDVNFLCALLQENTTAMKEHGL
jgi:hypothetical protein